MTLEELKNEIFNSIKEHPETYPIIVETATFSFQEYKKGLDAKEAEIHLLIGLIPKAIRSKILLSINRDMFHPAIIARLEGGIK